MKFLLLSVLRGPKAVVAMYDSGPAEPGAAWANFRRRVVEFVDRQLKTAQPKLKVPPVTNAQITP
jgi:hypothetical protein